MKREPEREGKFRSSYQGPKVRTKKKKRRSSSAVVLAGGAVVVMAVLIVGAVVKGRSGASSPKAVTTAESGAENAEAKTCTALTVNGIALNGLTKEEALAEIVKSYPWAIQVKQDEESEETEAVPDLTREWISECLTDIYQDGATGERELDETKLQELVADQVATYAEKWDKQAKNAVIDRYDSANGQFLFSDGCSGLKLNEEKMVSDIMSAVKNGQFDAVVQAEFGDNVQKLTIDEARQKYTTLATFTTETTENEKRNTNVRLAAEALNGTIVQPGEEFSFNAIVGQRTPEKGYQEAAAYNSGEVVQEVGGGVCQMSSTLYRVVFQAGMEVTYRRSHTFEPNYVTPGQDAAISWDYPDFRFVNTSEHPVGILASYSNRKATVSLYGIRVLPEGETWDLVSEKTEELDQPDPVYVEDVSLKPGTEKTVKAGTSGSRWVTYKVVYQNGQEVSRTEDHSKVYQGHSAEIHRNTAGGSWT